MIEKDEAIELLCAYGVPLDEKKFQEALDMAIKVLSAEYNHEWCKGCKEYDTEKHCCHRYSSFIRETLQDNINAVLEDIKKELENMQEEYADIDDGRFWGISDSLKIINNHISGKDQE